MESIRLCLLCLASSGLILLDATELALGLQLDENLSRQSREKSELVEALQEVLEKLGNRELPAVETRLSWVPLCQPGEPCAVRRGVRIGKRCSCPRSTTCNLVTLRCS
ncbi:cocaine- and amphetamine-regulated transcript protein [Cuculus canorus]|uniref:cocaine- and amphetamine-regulated transcript protein n=1 Tax=Cuculus canorus TaxID=55661 RepID=UPI0023AA2CAF|nr:cocaine- and amphetamine-regulated transcript protein [Cuculus canorus]